MSVKYSRLPSDDPEAGYVSAFDYRSAFSYGNSDVTRDKYKSAFTYSGNMMRQDGSLSVVKQSLTSRLCGVLFTFLGFLFCLATFPISAWLAFKVVPENERLVVFRLGRLRGAKGPGVVFVLPCIDKLKKVDIRMKAFNVPPLQLLTRDAAIVEMGADVYYQIQDAVRSITTVQDLNPSLRALVRNTLLKHLVKCELKDIEMKKQEVTGAVLDECNATVLRWGLTITRMEFSQVKVIQEPQSGATIPGGQTAISQMFQQLAGAFMNNGSGQGLPGMQPDLDTAVGASPGVSHDDVNLQMVTPHDLMAQVGGVLSEGLVRSVGAVFQFNLSGPGGGTFFLDLKHGSGKVGEGPCPSGNPDVTLELSIRTMQKMFSGKLKAFQAYMSGQLTVSGDLSAALSLGEVLDKVTSEPGSGPSTGGGGSGARIMHV